MAVFVRNRSCSVGYNALCTVTIIKFQRLDKLSVGFSTSASSPNKVKSFEDIPCPNPVQNIVQILTSGGLKNLTAIQEKKFVKYGPIFVDKILGKRVVNIADVDAIETLYRNESKFPLRPPFEVITESWREFGGILGNDYEAWIKVRSYSSPKMLRPAEVRKHCEDFNEIAADAVRRFKKIRDKERKVGNLELEAMGWSGEAMGKFVYGERLGFYEEPQNQRIFDFIEAATAFGDSVVKIGAGPPIWKYIETPTYKKLMKSIAQLEAIGDGFIAKIKARMVSKEETSNKSHALFDHFIRSGGLTSREMNAIALGLTQAAFEGTSFTAQWLIYHLSRHPKIQDEANREIHSVHGAGNEDFVSYESLAAMKFTRACVKEAQRLTPTALFLSRLTEQDMVLGGYEIPAGTDVFLFPSLLTQSPTFYPKPWSFEPDRWIDSKPLNPYSYLPFGHGVRMCLGRRVAELELLVLAVHLIRSFRMYYAGTKVPELEFRNGVHKPKEALHIVFEDRQNSNLQL